MIEIYVFAFSFVWLFPRMRYGTGCSLNIVFFEDFKIYSGLWPLSVSPRCQYVYTMAGQTPALQQNYQSSEKSHFKEKHNI